MRDEPERGDVSAPWGMRFALVAPLVFLAWCGWMLFTLELSRREDAGRAAAAVRLQGLEKSLLDLQQGSIVLWRYPVASDSVDRWRDLYRNYRAQVQQLEGKEPAIREVMDNLLRLYAAVGRTERIRQQLLTTKVPEDEARTLEAEFRSKIDVAVAEVKAALLKIRTPNPAALELKLWAIFALAAAVLALATAVILWLLGSQVGRARAAEAELAANREDVRAMESRFQAILDAAPDAFLVTDERGAVLAANQGVQKLIGFRPEDLAGKTLASVLPALTRRRGSGGPDDPETGWVEFETRRRDGASIVLDAIMRKTAVGGEPATLILLRAAGKNRRDAVLADQRDWLKSVFDSADLMLAVLDERGRVVSVNGTLERRTGLSFDQLRNRPLQEALAVETLAGGPGSFRGLKGVSRLTGPEGRLRIAWVGVEVPGRAGVPNTVIALGVDLAACVEAAPAPVPEFGEPGQLAVRVSQTLGDALTTIIGYSEMLLASMGADDAARGDVEEILAAGRRASAVAERLLLFTQRQALQPRPVDLNARIDALRSRLCLALGTGVLLSIEPAPDLEPVLVDPDRFDDMLLILARNAGEAMPRGGRVSIHTRNADLAGQGAWVEVSLRDTGTGIDAGTRRRLFEPFFTTKDPRKALGLGLATVRNFVHQSGGRVEVETAPGSGTSFSILLPAAAGRQAERPDGAVASGAHA